MKEYIIPDDFLDYETMASADGQGFLRELVRCGECKWFDREAFCESKSYGSCKLPLSHINTHCMIPEDYYCADGERKDGKE